MRRVRAAAATAAVAATSVVAPNAVTAKSSSTIAAPRHMLALLRDQSDILGDKMLKLEEVCRMRRVHPPPFHPTRSCATRRPMRALLRD